MNKDSARDYLPLVQALVDGKTVEFRLEDENIWRELPNLSFTYPLDQYRIKPEPREIWVNRYPNGMESGIFNTEHAAKLHRANDTAVQIRYREVIE